MQSRSKLLFAIICLTTGTALADGWKDTKNIADDIIYEGQSKTFYCGCEYASHGDKDGSGDITDTSSCGYVAPEKHQHRAGRVEWEHIVPASLMPASSFDCWINPDTGSRHNCEKADPRAQAMIFDLHNLAPSIGQVNALRSNDLYGLVEGEATTFGSCSAKDASGRFEPPDCLKGDVARVWLYMRARYGLTISDADLEMYSKWHTQDPVSPWESEREHRISKYSRVNNPFVDAVAPQETGACPWE